jgi:tetratricopeptide (TPR) repeat protein
MNEPPIALQKDTPRFYGRKTELDFIVEQATTWEDPGRSQILLIKGAGGIGKTMLVRQAADLLRSRHPDIACVGPLDMDDTDFRVASNTGRAIAEQLGKDRFSAYLNMLSRYQGKEQAGIDRATILAYMQSGDRYFIHDYAAYAKANRVAIFVDTVEAVRQTHLWIYFLRVMASLPNTLFVLSGRPARSPLGQDITSANEGAELEEFTKMPLVGPEGVHCLHLGGWTKKEAQQFVEEQAENQLGQRLPPRWVHNLLHLGRSQPLHLALAIERLQAGAIDLLDRDEDEIAGLLPLPDDDPREKCVAQGSLSRQSARDIEQTRLSAASRSLFGDFERTLVERYDAPNALAQAILRMAHLRRRLDESMYREVMAFAPAISNPPPWSELLKQPWIRRRAEGFVTLHDIFCELLEEYIWPLRDPKRDERSKLSRQMVDLYDRLIAKQQQDKETLDSEFQVRSIGLRTVPDQMLGELTDTLLRSQKVARDIWILKAEQLFYKFRADLQEGFQSFLEEFDRATQESQLMLRETLVLETEHFRNNFKIGAPEYYEIRRREAQAAIDEGGISHRAATIVRELEGHYTAPAQKYRLLNLLGNAYMRMRGQARQALDAFDQALAFALSVGLNECVGEALMELGWANRQLGHWKEAAQFYTDAVNQIPPDDPKLLAQTGTGLAYVEALMGRYVAAEEWIKTALEQRRLLGSPEEIGMSLSVQGEIFRYQRSFDQARKAYDEALKLFTEQGNMMWMGQVQQQLAIELLQEDPATNLQDAAYYINSALYLCNTHNPRAYPSALNRAGRIAIAGRRYSDAFSYFREGIEAAEIVSDEWFLIANCVQYSELAYEQWEQTDRPELRARIFDYAHPIEERENDPAYAFPDLFGRWHLVKGHVAWKEGRLRDDTKKWEMALQEYKKGFPFIAEGFYASSGIYALPRLGEVLEQHILALPAAEADRWCRELSVAWSTQRRFIVLQAIIRRIHSKLSSSKRERNGG